MELKNMFKTKDGQVEKFDSDFSINPLEKNLIEASRETTNVPRLLSECEITAEFHDIDQLSAEEKFHLLNLYRGCDQLSQCESEGVPIPSSQNFKVTISVSSTTALDRLVDFSLTKLRRDENAKFIFVPSEKPDLKFTMTIHLISFTEPPELHEFEPSCLIQISKCLKDEGKKLYSSKRICDSFHKFSQAAKLLTVINNENNKNEDIKPLLSTLYSNMAGCQLIRKNWEYTIDLCNQSLAIDPKNHKCLYRRGKSLMEIQEYEKADEDLKVALEENSGDLTLKTTMEELHRRKKALDKHYAAAMKKMFS